MKYARCGAQKSIFFLLKILLEKKEKKKKGDLWTLQSPIFFFFHIFLPVIMKHSAYIERHKRHKRRHEKSL